MKTCIERALGSLALVSVVLGLAGCSFEKKELGSEANPIKLFFVPSVDAKVIDSNSKLIKALLEKNTPYKYVISIPQSYIAVVEAFGSGRADVAALNTYGYYLAHKKYGAEAKLTVIRHGEATYRSAILAKKGRFKNISELAGRKIAFVDPASMSGYSLPLKFLADSGIKLGETIFAMKHDNVVSMIYQGQVDAGATFYSPPDSKDGIQDARRLVKTQYPDVEGKVEILQLTSEIPNDPITFRKDMPEKIKNAVVEGFLKTIATDEGKQAFKNIYSVTELKRATDKDYAMLVSIVENSQIDPEAALKKK